MEVGRVSLTRTTVDETAYQTLIDLFPRSARRFV